MPCFEGLADEDEITINWGELKRFIHYNQVISEAFMQISEIFVEAGKEIQEGID